MTEPSGSPGRQGQPRTERDAALIERFDSRIRLPLIISAILPLIVVPQQGNWVSIVIGVVTWLVFLVDYVVHERHLQHFGRTAFGRFDLVIVIATAPWFLLPGAHGGSFVVLLRLARLGRLVMASPKSRQLFDRLGRVGAVAIGVLVTASLVAYFAEHPTNPEFATFGDALWWGIVTMTTVGYGDIVPKTPTGRWAAVVIMLTGVAVLGLLAGSLASFFRLDKGTSPGAVVPRRRHPGHGRNVRCVDRPDNGARRPGLRGGRTAPTGRAAVRAHRWSGGTRGSGCRRAAAGRDLTRPAPAVPSLWSSHGLQPSETWCDRSASRAENRSAQRSEQK
jgi:voltage-gated potassium channel